MISRKVYKTQLLQGRTIPAIQKAGISFAEGSLLGIWCDETEARDGGRYQYLVFCSLPIMVGILLQKPELLEVKSK